MTVTRKLMDQIIEAEAAAQAHDKLVRTLETIHDQARPLRAALESIPESTALTDQIDRAQTELVAAIGPMSVQERLLGSSCGHGAPRLAATESFRQNAALEILREYEERDRAQLRSLILPQNELQSLLAAIEKDMTPLCETLEELRSDAARDIAREIAAGAIGNEYSWLRASLGPAAELGLVGTSGVGSVLGNVFHSARDLFADYESRFRLPDIAEARDLFAEARHLSNLFPAAGVWQTYADDIERAAEAMHTPWLDMQDKLQSVAGFAELQRIGISLRESHPFEDHLADQLRAVLGDWRDTIAWPDNIVTDPWTRTDFYAARGLDPRLTRFPREAFKESITIAGLRDTPLPFLDQYNGTAGEEDEEEAGFVRTNDAHNRLMRFEHQLRQFIDTVMTAAFGEQWTKHRLPGDIRKSWAEKHQAALDCGEPDRPLIAYADFTDYVQIIARKDNWEEVFKRVFRRRESVQESLQRLYPIRNCTMHSRIITQDDQLYLHTEIRRIARAIKTSK